MLSQAELNAIKERAEQKQQAWLDLHPAVQVPPDEGRDVLTLIQEIERLQGALGDAAVTDWPVLLDQL